MNTENDTNETATVPEADTVSAHFVTFYSPGTLFAEQREVGIDSWDVDAAVEMSYNIVERYGAKPYGFRFSTRSRGPKDLDSKETGESPMYYLGGDVLTLEQIKERNDPKDKTLLFNMECNGWDRVITNCNSYRSTWTLNDDDIVLDYQPKTETAK